MESILSRHLPDDSDIYVDKDPVINEISTYSITNQT